MGAKRAEKRRVGGLRREVGVKVSLKKKLVMSRLNSHSNGSLKISQEIRYPESGAEKEARKTAMG